MNRRVRIYPRCSTSLLNSGCAKKKKEVVQCTHFPTFTVNIDPFLLLGIIGMVLILLAFLLNQRHIWTEDMLRYDLCNAIGSLLLVIYAYEGRAWPFVILNGVWAAYSLKDIITDVTGMPGKKSPARPQPK